MAIASRIDDGVRRNETFQGEEQQEPLLILYQVCLLTCLVNRSCCTLMTAECSSAISQQKVYLDTVVLREDLSDEKFSIPPGSKIHIGFHKNKLRLPVVPSDVWSAHSSTLPSVQIKHVQSLSVVKSQICCCSIYAQRCSSHLRN